MTLAGSTAQPNLPMSNREINHENRSLDEKIQRAIAQITTGDFHSRWDSTKQYSKQFAEWGDRSVEPLIAQLQAESDPTNQGFLVRVLSQFNRPEVACAIAQLLMATPEEDVQIEATKALTTLGSVAIETLSTRLKTPDLPQKILAARALSHIRRSSVITPLLSVATHPNSELRAIALETLGSFHDPRITPLLIAATEDEPIISKEAIRALGRRSDLLETTDLISPLTRTLSSPDESVAKESAIALGRLGSPAAISALANLLSQPRPTAIKVAAVRALGWSGTRMAIESMAEAFNDTVPVIMPEVKLEIARSLGQTYDDYLKAIAARPLITWLKNRAAHPSPSETNTAEQVILQLKQTVILALSRLDATDAIEPLVASLDDTDTRVRMHALSALKQLDPDNRHLAHHI